MIAGTPASAETLRQLKQQHPAIFAQQGRYLRTVGLIALAIVLYYVFFFLVFGISWPQFINGCQQLGRYFLRMFVWHDFANWPFMYYFQQIGITIAIVFAGTITASLIALPLSFFAARNVMSTPLLRPISVLVRRLLDVLRGIDMAIWGLIFVRAVGMGPLAGVLAIVMQDVGLLGKLYAEGHEAVDKSPSRGLTAVGANGLQKHRYGIFTQSVPHLPGAQPVPDRVQHPLSGGAGLRRRRRHRPGVCGEYAAVELGRGDVHHPDPGGGGDDHGQGLVDAAQQVHHR